MTTATSDLIKINELSTSQRKFSLGQTRDLVLADLETQLSTLPAPSSKKAAAPVPEPPLVVQTRALLALIDQGIEHDVGAMSIENKYARDRKKPQGSPEMRACDAKMDRLIGRFIRIGKEHASGENDVAPKVRDMLVAIVPNGTESITNRMYSEEYEAVEELLAKIHGPESEYGALIKEIGLSLLVSEIATQQLEYGRLVKLLPSNLVNYGMVRAARATGMNYLRRVVAGIAYMHGSESAEDTKTRARLMSPIVLELEKAAAAAKRGSRAPDEPDDEADEADADADAGSPASADAAAPAGSDEPT